MTDAAISVRVDAEPWLSSPDRWRQRIDAAISRNFQALRECDSCWRRVVACRCGGGE